MPANNPPGEPREGFTAVGQVLRPHGLKGEIRVLAFAAGAPNLQRGRRVHLEGECHTVLRARPDRDAWIIQLDGLTERAGADQARGELLEVADADVRRLDAESFFVYELIGLRVVTSDGRDLGRLTEVLQTGANDVYVVKGEQGEVLVPAIGDVVEAIDLANRIVRITPLAGMLNDSK